MRLDRRQSEFVRPNGADGADIGPLPGIRVEYAVSGNGRTKRPEMSTPADCPPHSLPEDTAMTAEVLTFPSRPVRSKAGSDSDQDGTVISLDAYRGAARLRRTMTGVYFVTPAQLPTGDSSAA